MHPVVEEKLALGGEILFHQSGEPGRRQPDWEVKPALLDVPTPGPIVLGRIPGLNEVVLAYRALTTGIGWHAFSDHVLRVPVRSDDISGGLNDQAGNFLTVWNEIASDLDDLNTRQLIIKSLQHVNPTVSSIELNDIQNPGDIIAGHRYNGTTLVLKLSQESAGFRRFFAHLLALYQRPGKQTLIFEHPEDGIHPGALSLLADEFKVAATKFGRQVILTTHNPKLLDQFEPEQIRVVEMSESAGTQIGCIAQDQKEAIKDNLLEPGELLTVVDAKIDPQIPEPAGT